MTLIITEEQQMLKTSAAEYLKTNAPVSALRKLRDDKDPVGYSESLWKEMAEMGWASLTIPEAFGGLDFGFTGLGQILEETGRRLTSSPLVSTVLLGATAIHLGGNVLQKESLLPQVSEGRLTLALALEESNHHNPESIATGATKKGGKYIINGQKTFVLDGHISDKIIVVAKIDEDEDLGLFIVDRNAEGVTVERTIMMDSRNAANISLDDVEIGDDSILDNYTSGQALCEKVLDIARIGLAAEMLGSIQEIFERTLAYLKDRVQFGVRIGSFQALQHRAAIMYGEIELCKSIVIKSLKAIDEEDPHLPRYASLAKAKLSETIKLVSNEGIQMFGGIGVTDDEEIGFFLKRARVAQMTFGDANYHLDRYAKIKAF